MYSYFAIIAKNKGAVNCATDIAKTITAKCPQYAIALQADRFFFFHANSHIRGFRSYILNADQGAIAGTLFRRTSLNIGEKVPHGIDRNETEHIINSQGLALINRYWGRYAAFIINRRDSEYYIIRDPTGSMPLYYYDSKDLIVLFSDFEHFMQLDLTKFNLNIDYIASFLRHQFLPHSGTGVKEIQQVLRGTRLTIREGGAITTTPLWRHQDFCQRGSMTDPTEAANILRTTITDCIHAWAGEFDTIALSLSGGLDSSIVLSCLSTAPNKPNIICYNQFTPGEVSDERKFARQAAARAGVKLVEIQENPDDVDFAALDNFPIQPEPRPWRQAIGFGKTQHRIFNETNADTFFTGEGGDMVFNQGAAHVIEDYVWHHGLSGGTIKQAMLFSRLKGLTFWSVLYAAAMSRISPPRWDFTEWALPHLSSEIEPDIDIAKIMWEGNKYWADGLSNVSIAKAKQIGSMLFSNFSHRPNGYSRYLPLVQPLFSQPIIELAVKLPAYLLSWPGVDRGLARLAFKGTVPDDIIFRQSKGSPGKYYDEVNRILNEKLNTKDNDPYFESLLIDQLKYRQREHPGRADNLHLFQSDEVIKYIQVYYWLSKLKYCMR